MASFLTQTTATQYGNTGIPNTSMQFGLLKFAVLVPKGTSWLQQTIANPSFQSTLIALLNNDNPAQRAYIVGAFEASVSNGADWAFETFTDSKIQVATSKPTVEFTHRLYRGGIEQIVQLSKFDMTGRFDIIYVDTNNVMWGTQVLNPVTGQISFKGFTLNMCVTSVPKPATGGSVENNEWRVGLANGDELRKYPAEITCDFDWASTMFSMVTINLNLISFNSTTFIAKVKGNIGLGGDDLYATYGSVLSSTSVWVVSNATTGLPIPVSAASGDTTGFSLTLTNTSPNYPAGGYVTVTLARPSVLTASPFLMAGLEANTVKFNNAATI